VGKPKADLADLSGRKLKEGVVPDYTNNWVLRVIPGRSEHLVGLCHRSGDGHFVQPQLQNSAHFEPFGLPAEYYAGVQVSRVAGV
jgi:hypothetical protein